MYLFRFILASFATYRLAELFCIDDGPFLIFKRFRQVLGMKAAGKSSRNIWYSLALLFQCPFCLGVWIAAFMLIPIYFQNIISDIFLFAFAISGAQAFLETVGRRLP